MAEQALPLRNQLSVGNTLWINGALNQITAYDNANGYFTLASTASNGTAAKVFTGSISGTTLTVSVVTTGVLAIGDIFFVGGLPNQITGSISGAGGIGMYQIYFRSITASASYNIYTPVPCATYTLSNNIPIDVMTVSAIASGLLTIGQQFYTGSTLNTIIAFGTGVGGTGKYFLSNASTISTATAFIALPTSLTQNLFVDINFGKSYVYEQNNSMTTKIGICYPIIEQQYNTVLSYYYCSNLNDNLPITIGYPTNQNITVNIYQHDNISIPTLFVNYVIQLKFTPIKNKY